MCCEETPRAALGRAGNARATAGARMVEAREALGRTPKTRETEYAKAHARLVLAEADYLLAQRAEHAAYRAAGLRSPYTEET